MKKYLLLLIVLLSSLYASAAVQKILINNTEYQVDTLVNKVVGPGNTFLRIDLPELPVRAYVLIIDTHNEYNRIETFLANDKIEGTELVTKACVRNTYEGHHAYCGINGDFFNIQAHNELPLGAPRGGSIFNGIVQREPRDAWWSFATVDENGVPFIDYMEFKGSIKSAAGDYKFKHMNIPFMDCNMTFFNEYVGNVTTQDKNSNYNDGQTKTEVYIVPVEGQKWGVNQEIKCKVTKKTTNLGSNPIAKGESVLSGVRDAKEYLDKLNVGDEITVNMSIRTTTRNEYPKLREMIGGNAMLMIDGVLTNRNTNDGYNVNPYPRTAVGTSKDKRWLYLLVTDGKRSYRGATTTEVACILKHYGASDVAGFDGGGSSEMIVNNRVANDPADGTERSVGNGWMVVSTAPTDSTIARIRSLQPKLILPVYGVAKPEILGYNQYDALLSENVEATFSCDAKLGTVDSDNVFTAAGTPGYGILTAHYGEITVEIPVEIRDVDNFRLRRERVIVDDKHPSPIDVLTQFGAFSYPVNPKVFDWKSSDENICTVTDGILHGIINGETEIVGTLGETANKLIVSVQIPTGDVMPVFYPTFPTEDITLKQTGGKDISISEFEHGFKLYYTGTGATRGAYINISGNMVAWSLPEAIRLRINPGDASIKKITLNAVNASEERILSWVFSTKELPKDTESTLELPLSDWCTVTDLGIYPIRINSIIFNMGKSDKDKTYTISVPGFEAVYPAYGGVEAITADKNALKIYPNPVNTSEPVKVTVNGTATAGIYTMNGVKVAETEISGAGEISTKDICPGVYFIQVVQNNVSKTGKIIIK